MFAFKQNPYKVILGLHPGRCCKFCLCSWMKDGRIYYIQINVLHLKTLTHTIKLKALQLENILFPLNWTKIYC